MIAFDNAGVGGTTGTTPDTAEQMADDAIAFLDAVIQPTLIFQYATETVATTLEFLNV